MRKQRQLPFNDTDDHWVSTSQSTYTHHYRPAAAAERMPQPAAAPYPTEDPPARLDARAAWYAALGVDGGVMYYPPDGSEPHDLDRHRTSDAATWHPSSNGGRGALHPHPGDTRGYVAQAQQQRQLRAQTPPPSQRGGGPNAATLARDAVLRSGATTPQRRGRRMVVASRCTDDHIVFENTKYEDPVDPLFYATHYAATDGVADRGVEAQRQDTCGTDFEGLINRYGFPGKQHTVARRKALVGPAQERTMNLFSREQNAAASPTARFGGPRRHLSPQPQSMSTTFQAVGDEVPFFRGGRRCAGLDHVYDDYDHTQRVLRTEKQDPPAPYRAHVRVGLRRPNDELAYTLQGSAMPQRDTRRNFFEPRR